MENMVDIMMTQESAPDDTVQATEQETLEDVLAAPEAEEQKEQQLPATEPGWIKQRVQKAVNKAVAETEARMNARYEAMLAPIREAMLDREASELVASGEFKNIERAKEYVRLKNGAPAAVSPQTEAQPAVPSRDAQGRFTKAVAETDNDPVVAARADLLAKQAQKIKASRGVDVMEVFNSDPAVKQRVLSGEWDFYDVAENAAAPRERIPSPTRNPNGQTTAGLSIANMSDAQFKRLQQNLANGKTYNLRK